MLWMINDEAAAPFGLRRRGVVAGSRIRIEVRPTEELKPWTWISHPSSSR
jgi:hypothetical protein